MKITSVEIPIKEGYVLGYDEVQKWLKTYIGHGVNNDCDAWRDPNCQWSMWLNHYKGSIMFEFKNPEHALQFKLAWG